MVVLIIKAKDEYSFDNNGVIRNGVSIDPSYITWDLLLWNINFDLLQGDKIIYFGKVSIIF